MNKGVLQALRPDVGHLFLLGINRGYPAQKEFEVSTRISGSMVLDFKTGNKTGLF